MDDGGGMHQELVKVSKADGKYQRKERRVRIDEDMDRRNGRMHQKMILSSASIVSPFSPLSNFKRKREGKKRGREKRKKEEKERRRNLLEGKNCIQRHEMKIRVKMSFPFLVSIRLFVSFDVFLLSHFSPSGHLLSLSHSLFFLF